MPTGISEAGANIGRMTMIGMQNAAEGLASGIQQYYENSAKWDAASQEADMIAQDIARTQQTLLSNPAYAPFAERLAPVVESLASVKTKSLPQALGILNTAKATWGNLAKDLQIYDVVRKDNEVRLFGDAMNQKFPNRIVPVNTAPEELIWDYTKTYNDNRAMAGAYWEASKAKYGDQVDMMPKEEWIDSWARSLETRIANDTDAPIQVRDKAIENIRMMQYGLRPQDNPADEDLWAQEYYGSYDIPEMYNPNIPQRRMSGDVGSPVIRDGSVSSAANTPRLPDSGIGRMVVDENGNMSFENPSAQAGVEAAPAGRPLSEWRGQGGSRKFTPEAQVEKYLGMAQEGIYAKEQALAERRQAQPVAPAPAASRQPLETSPRPQNYERDVGRNRLVQRVQQIANEHNELRSQYIASGSESKRQQILGKMNAKMAEMRRVQGLLSQFDAAPAPVAEPTPEAEDYPVETAPAVPPPPSQQAPAAPAPAPALPPPPSAAPAPSGIPPSSQPRGGRSFIQGDIGKKNAELEAEIQRTREIEAQAKSQEAGVQPTPALPAPQAQAPAPAPAAPALPPPESAAPKQVAPPALPAPESKAPAAPAKESYVQIPSRKQDGTQQVYKIDHNAPRYEVIEQETLFNISRRTGADALAIAKANGFPQGISHQELLEFSKKNGGIIIPKKLDPSEIPADIKKGEKRKFSTTGGGRSPFAAVMPSMGDIPVREDDETPVAQPRGYADKIDASRKPIKPVAPVSSQTGFVPKMTPEVSEKLRLESGMSKDQWAKVQAARAELYSRTDSLRKKQMASQSAIDYVSAIRDSVADGDTDLVDFGPYGQWENLNPDAAMGVNAFAVSASVARGFSKAKKAMDGYNSYDRTKKVSEMAKKAQQIYKATLDKVEPAANPLTGGFPRVITDAQKAAAMKKAIAATGAELKYSDLVRLVQLEKDFAKAGMSAMLFGSVFEAVLGAGNPLTGSATTDPDIKSQLAQTLDGVRKLRTGYTPMLAPFGSQEGFARDVASQLGGYKPMTPEEQVNIVGYLDDKLREMTASASTYEQEIALNNEDLVDNQRLLMRFDGLRTAGPTSKEVDNAPSYTPTKPFRSDAVQIATMQIGPTPEEKKSAMRDFMQKRLGYVPAGFEEMYQQQFPESMLRFQETPYGVLFHDGKSWQQMKTGDAKNLTPDDIAKQKAVVFGELQSDGTYKPTEFIKGSGVKIGGIGAFGTPEGAYKFRTEYPKLFKARQIARELMAINEQAFRSMNPELWGKSAAKVAELIAQMRLTLIGVGSVSDFEQQILRDLVQDPTKFFSLQSTTRAKYEAMIENINMAVETMPQSYGLTVELPEKNQEALKNARARYIESGGWRSLSPQQQAQIRASVQ